MALHTFGHSSPPTWPATAKVLSADSEEPSAHAPPPAARTPAKAQRAGALGIGLLSGRYGREELERSGAYRVYADPAEMLTRLEEVGVRPIR